MSSAELMRAVRALSRQEKYQLAQLLLDDLARGEAVDPFPAGQVFPICTPEYLPGTATQLVKPLEEGAESGNEPG